jgi:MFS-type transporter involved in bile tolerance (Atg22 family)
MRHFPVAKNAYTIPNVSPNVNPIFKPVGNKMKFVISATQTTWLVNGLERILKDWGDRNLGKFAELHFYIIAALVGLVMGGIQSLSRSTYSKLMPVTKDTTSFFSFYDVTEKLAIVIGLFSFGFIEGFTGSMRNSILALIGFFAMGLLFLMLTFFAQARAKIN